MPIAAMSVVLMANAQKPDRKAVRNQSTASPAPTPPERAVKLP